ATIHQLVLPGGTFKTLDVTGPQISAVTAVPLTATSVTISWTTSEPATSQVEYGLTTDYGSLTTLDTTLTTSHTIILTGLSDKATYHFRVKSKDATGNLSNGTDGAFAGLRKRGGQLTSD